MRKVAYLDCPICVGEQLFVLYEGRDEHMSECRDCGYRYGYIDHEASTVVDELGKPVTTYAPRPVLSREVLEAGMLKLQTEVAESLIARYGVNYRARHASLVEHHAGMKATDDPGLRARLLRSTAPGLRPKS